jgi:hypothetical protein
MGPWETLFRGLIQDGIVRGVSVEQITDFVSNVLYGTMFTNCFSGRKITLASQCENILDLLFKGLLVRSEDSLHGNAS